MNKLFTLSLTGAMVGASLVCGAFATEGETAILLRDSGVLVNGTAASTADTAAVYTANDIIFYLADQGFTYGAGDADDEHTQAEADQHTVVHITEPGTYRVSGKLSYGQLFVDLGKEAETDPNAVVTLILDGVDINCTVAPGVFFYNVYECGSTDTETAVSTVDTSDAGANVILADGSENTVSGSHVARIYKSVELSEDGTSVVSNKKLHKYDAAFYSKMSMNIDGEANDNGKLTVNADNEGLDSELHLTMNGGNVTINSCDDGINTNEDGVSVTTINGGSLRINAGGGAEGDGIDSNGWLVINGGTVISCANPNSMDAGIDSDMGIILNGGHVVASGNMLDAMDTASSQKYMVLSFSQKQDSDSALLLRNENGNDAATFTPENTYSILVYSDPALTEQAYSLWQVSGATETTLTRLTWGGQSGGMMGGGMRPEGMEPPEGFDPSQMGERPEVFDPAQMGERPEGFDPAQMGERPEGFDPSQMGGRPGGMMQSAGVSPIFTLDSDGAMFSGIDTVENNGLFDDVKSDSWFFPAVNTCYDSGVVKGADTTTFAPESNITRADFLLMLYRAADATKPEQSATFTDVAADAYYADAIAWSEANGIAEGNGDGTFSPASAITREQAFAILSRALPQLQITAAAGSADDLTVFSDAASISAWFTDDLATMVKNDLVHGTDGALLPQNSLTRAETAQVFANLMN